MHIAHCREILARASHVRMHRCPQTIIDKGSCLSYLKICIAESSLQLLVGALVLCHHCHDRISLLDPKGISFDDIFKEAP